MTTRDSDFDPALDTQLDKRFTLYEHFRMKGHRVLVIPDQYDVLFPQKFKQYGWEVAPEAAMDLDLRLALHQMCHATISWAVGAAFLLWYSNARFLMFGGLNEQSAVADKRYYQSRAVGITVGKQPSFFLTGQFTDWTPVADLLEEYLIDMANMYIWPASDRAKLMRAPYGRLTVR